MKRSVRYGWLVVGLCVGFLMLFGPSVTLAAPQDAAPVSEPTTTPAVAPAPAAVPIAAPVPAAVPAAAPAPAKRDAFSAGTKRLTVVVGNGYAFDNSYLLI